MNQDFYVTICSDSSSPDIGTLKAALGLNKMTIGSFEVALVEISFPITWKVNFGRIIMETYDDNGVHLPNSAIPIDFVMYDHTPMGQFGFQISRKTFAGFYRYQPVEETMSLGIDKPAYKTKIIPRWGFDSTFAKTFRLISKDANQMTNIAYANNVKPTLIKESLIHVHCSLICDQFDYFGTSKLLRTIKVKGKACDDVHNIFDSPHYVRVSNTNISEFEISIKDHLQNNIHFESGRVTVKLHFRRRIIS